MMNRMDISDLISYLAQKSLTDDVSLDINEIKKLGHAIEERHPSVTIDMDKYSIESFRIKSKGNVIIHNKKIEFNRTNEVVKMILKRSQPSEKLTFWLDEINFCN